MKTIFSGVIAVGQAGAIAGGPEIP